MRRIAIVGSGGAGKSTLARRLGAVTGLPVIHLDREFWRPGWVRPSDAEWDARLAELLAGEAWILDGNFSRTMERRFAEADTIVLLDPPTIVCMWRALRRATLGRSRRRADLAEGCSERIDLEFLRWVWRFRRKQIPKIERHLAALVGGQRIEILRSDADVEAFLERARSG
jgi:adenylate kinase family enzyme